MLLVYCENNHINDGNKINITNLLVVLEPFVLKLFFGVNEIDFNFCNGLHKLGSFNLIILCGVGGDWVVVGTG